LADGTGFSASEIESFDVSPRHLLVELRDGVARGIFPEILTMPALTGIDPASRAR
jgi:hypothetical protein